MQLAFGLPMPAAAAALLMLLAAGAQGLSLRGLPIKELYLSDDSLNTNEKRSVSYLPVGLEEFAPYGSYYYNSADEMEAPSKRDDQAMPGVLRFGKRSQSFVRFGRDVGSVDKKEMPGVLRFGKRSAHAKKAVPDYERTNSGVLRFGKRSPEMPGVLRFGKRDVPEMPGVLRFGKKSEMPGVLRFGKRGAGGDMPGVLRFGKRDVGSEMPGVLRFGRK